MSRELLAVAEKWSNFNYLKVLTSNLSAPESGNLSEQIRNLFLIYLAASCTIFLSDCERKLSKNFVPDINGIYLYSSVHNLH